MNTKLLSLLALTLLAIPATAGDVRFTFRGAVTTASNPNGAYTGVQVGDPVELRCEVFLTNPAPVVIAPGQYVDYAIDTTTMTMSIGSVNVAYGSGTPRVGMINAFPVSDGIQDVSASMGGKSVAYSLNHNGSLFVSTDPLGNLGTHTITPDGSFSFSFQATGGGSFIEMFPSNITIERIETGTTYCAGDGSGTACPCANSSAPGDNVGCLTSFGVGGKVRAYGAASIAGDLLVLQGTQMPNSSALYFQGTNQIASGAGVPFGDGLRCVSGSVRRLGTKNNVSGASQYPVTGDLSISVKGGIVAPGTYYYQVWFRNAASFCTASTFNLTNALSITWS